MALEQFRPTLWSRQLIVDTDKAQVFGNIARANVDQQITEVGQVLKINEIGDLTIRDYSEDTDITIETLPQGQRELVIDQQKYFAFQVDDIAMFQSQPELMQGATEKAGFNLADVSDSFLAGLYSEAGVTDTATLGTDFSTHQDVYAASSGNDGILGVITNMEIALNENNVPGTGRFIVWPYWGGGYLKHAGIVDDIAGVAKPQLLPNGQYGPGFVGNVLGFDHYVSNNVVKSGDAHAVMFGRYGSLAFAEQIMKMESIRREKQFADMVRGLHVYGGKVVRPDELGVAYLDPVGLSS
jgi:hypothetical protein